MAAIEITSRNYIFRGRNFGKEEVTCVTRVAAEVGDRWLGWGIDRACRGDENVLLSM